MTGRPGYINFGESGNYYRRKYYAAYCRGREVVKHDKDPQQRA
jgi:hypothetical protein